MTDLLRRLRAAVAMGLTWAVAWAGVGFAIELVQEVVPGWNGAIVDIWPAVLAYPAFLGGVAFSGILAVAGRRRRFDEMSLPRFALWGALGGLPLSAVGLLSGGASTGTLIGAAVVSLLCSTSAVATLAIARSAEDRELLDAAGAVAEVGLTGDERAELLGRG